MHEIEEFAAALTVPEAAITDEIVANVRDLTEVDHIEAFLRQILYDPNETPHGPTEIADILTTRVGVRGHKTLGAFVLKGRGTRSVTSRLVTHQFARLRTISGLDVMVFLATGNIQDDAQRDFVRTALDADVDYIAVDARDCARLFIAYDTICPKDGTPYDDTGTCSRGHVLDEGITVEFQVREDARYSLEALRDLSHGGAKRYSAIVLADRHYSRDVLRTIIGQVTDQVRSSSYYRSPQTRARWGRHHAHVVWLFFAFSPEDIQNANWVCRTLWIDPALDESMRPASLEADERLDNTALAWNPDYLAHGEFVAAHTASKGEFLDALTPELDSMLAIARGAITAFETYAQDEIPEDHFIQTMQSLGARADESYNKSADLPLAPADCREYDNACQALFGTAHNMFLFYSEKGLATWPKENRDWLMRDTIKHFHEDRARMEFEQAKIHQA
jgi:hypothetical protein